MYNVVYIYTYVVAAFLEILLKLYIQTDIYICESGYVFLVYKGHISRSYLFIGFMHGAMLLFIAAWLILEFGGMVWCMRVCMLYQNHYIVYCKYRDEAAAPLLNIFYFSFVRFLDKYKALHWWYFCLGKMFHDIIRLFQRKYIIIWRRKKNRVKLLLGRMTVAERIAKLVLYT